MTTKLTGPLKREVEIEGQLYTLTITPDALRLVPKGRRKGYELGWKSLVSGEAALAAALNASLLDAPTSDRRPAKRGQSSQQKTRQ
jgi:hypothetical protein